MDDAQEKLVQDLGQAVSQEYDADVFLYSGAIDDEGFGKVIEVVSANKKHDKAILVLTSSAHDKRRLR